MHPYSASCTSRSKFLPAVTYRTFCREECHVYHHPCTLTQNPFSSRSGHSSSDYTQRDCPINGVVIKELMYGSGRPWSLSLSGSQKCGSSRLSLSTQNPAKPC